VDVQRLGGRRDVAERVEPGTQRLDERAAVALVVRDQPRQRAGGPVTAGGAAAAQHAEDPLGGGAGVHQPGEVVGGRPDGHHRVQPLPHAVEDLAQGAGAHGDSP